MIRHELSFSDWDKSFAHIVNILTEGSVTLAKMLNLALGRVGVARSWQLWPLERDICRNICKRQCLLPSCPHNSIEAAWQHTPSLRDSIFQIILVAKISKIRGWQSSSLLAEARCHQSADQHCLVSFELQHLLAAHEISLSLLYL